MKVFRGLDQLPKFKNAVLTIGTYDGVHYGHQYIINRINKIVLTIPINDASCMSQLIWHKNKESLPK